MAPTKHNWAFSLLWINLAVALVVLVQAATNQFANFGDFLRTSAFVLLYANLTGVLGVLILGRLATRPAIRRFPLPAAAAGILLLTGLGCLAARALLVATGFIAPAHFWLGYLSTLRLALPLAVVFGAGALVHASLWRHLELIREQLREKEAAEERARRLAAEARLHSLEARIHPHFLFNTLNSISSLIAMDPPRAEQIVGRLAALLRASLDTSGRSLIPLREELAMVESYVDIERVRFGDKLRGTVDVPAELQNANVPPMSVQSLVENAVKHGITPLSGGGEFLVTASAENGSLRIEVRDTGPGFDLAAVQAGHGLDSLVERLDAIFGEKARLNVLRRDGYCVAEMVLPRA